MTKKKEDPQLEPDKVTEETPSAEQTAEQAQGSTEVAASDEQVDEQTQGGTEVAASDEQTAEQAQDTFEDAQTSVLEDIARRTMREHDLERVYVSSDGTAFYARHDAHNHARNLVDDTIFAIEPEEDNE